MGWFEFDGLKIYKHAIRTNSQRVGKNKIEPTRQPNPILQVGLDWPNSMHTPSSFILERNIYYVKEINFNDKKIRR